MTLVTSSGGSNGGPERRGGRRSARDLGSDTSRVGDRDHQPAPHDGEARHGRRGRGPARGDGRDARVPRRRRSDRPRRRSSPGAAGRGVGQALTVADHPRAASPGGRHLRAVTRVRRVRLRPRERRARVPHAAGAVPLPRRRRAVEGGHGCRHCRRAPRLARRALRCHRARCRRARRDPALRASSSRHARAHNTWRYAWSRSAIRPNAGSRAASSTIAWPTLPTIGRVPRLGGGVATQNPIADPALDDAFLPLLRWIVEHQVGPARDQRLHVVAGVAPHDGHVAARLYGETFDR